MHDSRGLGLRFDAGEDGLFGTNNNLQFNVCFRNLQGGLSGKSNNASNYRNTAIDNQGGADPEAGTFGEAADFKVCHRKTRPPQDARAPASARVRSYTKPQPRTS